ncbi:MAG TPA: 6-phosphogluconolactonase [Spirochaetales bacterium]|nr:6-phosphogluconolactonase [Spirochaetales bacterium]
MNLVRLADERAWIEEVAADFLAACAAVPTGRPLEAALSGGSTPEPVYRALAALDVRRPVRLRPGDERLVPGASPLRNGAMIARAFADAAWSPAPEFRFWPEGEDGAAVAAAYAAAIEAELPRDAAGLPRFDLCWLGMGPDGHVAGLFPGDAGLEVADRSACPATAPSEPRARVTLSLPAILASERIRLLVRGADKLDLLERVASGDLAAAALPAARVLEAPNALAFWCP